MTPTGAGLVTAVAVIGTSMAVVGRPRGSVRLPHTDRAVAAMVPAPIVACCDALDGAVDPVPVWRVLRVGLVGAPLVLLATVGPIPAILVPIAIVAGPRSVLPALMRRRSTRRDAQLAPALEQLASAVRAGRSVRGALVEVAASTPSPLGGELSAIADALHHGATVEDAMTGWVTRAGASAEVRLAGAAISLGGQAGGEVARALDGVAATLRERRELRGEVVALATQARASAGVLVLAPLGFAGLVSTIQPHTLAFLVATPVGLGCLAGGLGLEAVGGWWMARIVRQAE